MFQQLYDDKYVCIYTSIKGFWMKKTWFLESRNLELNCKSYKRNSKLCFKNEKNEHQKLLFIPRFVWVLFIRSIVCIFTVHELLFIRSIICILLFTNLLFIICIFTVHSVWCYCSQQTIHKHQTVLFIVCCHFLLIRGKIYISRSRHYFGNPNGQNLDLCVGNLL